MLKGIEQVGQTKNDSVGESGGERRRSLWLWLAACAGLVVMFVLDNPVLDGVEVFEKRRLFENFERFLDEIVRWLGNGRLQIPALLLLVFLGAILSRRLLRAGWRGLIAFAVSGAVCNVLKVLIHRPRPWVTTSPPTNWHEAMALHSYQSFPSGDATTTFAIAAAIGATLPRARWALYGIGAIVAVERVLLSVHHPSDVWAGAMLGIAAGRLVVRPPRVTREGLRRALPFILLGLFAAAILLAGLGSLPLFGRDESLYSEAAREMSAPGGSASGGLSSGDWIVPRVNAQPFLEKPPLYYWLAAASYHALGVSPFAARLPAALLGIATVLLVALVGARVWGRRAGLLAGLTLATSLQVAFIGRMGIMDVPLMFLTAAALLCYASWRQKGGLGYAVGFGALVGLAALLKAMAGLIPVLVVVAHSVFYRQEKRRPWALPLLTAAVVGALVAAPWFAAMLRSDAFQQTLLTENLARMARPMQGHGGPVFYYFALILISFFPWIMFLPAAMGRKHLATRPADEPAIRPASEPEPAVEAELWRSLSLVWFVAVIIPISLMSTKLPGYVTPLFPAMALLVGPELERRWQRPGHAPWIAVMVLAALMVGLLSWVAVSKLPEFAATMEASGAVRRLLPFLLLWAGTYVIAIMGALLTLTHRPRWGTYALILGQTAAFIAIFVGILPALVPYMEGSREYRLAEIAKRELPHTPVVLYETRPEAVAFVLGHPVATFNRDQQPEVLSELAKGSTALIAPTKAEDRDFLSRLPVRRKWQVGDRVLLEVGRVSVLARRQGPGVRG